MKKSLQLTEIPCGASYESPSDNPTIRPSTDALFDTIFLPIKDTVYFISDQKKLHP